MGRKLQKIRSNKVKGTFAHVLKTGGGRRWLIEFHNPIIAEPNSQSYFEAVMPHCTASAFGWPVQHVVKRNGEY
jgi:hypothetical protein